MIEVKEVLDSWIETAIPKDELEKEAHDIIVKALEKQIPKKMEYDSRCEVYECPNCESKYDNPQNDGILCCVVCGQAIDWTK